MSTLILLLLLAALVALVVFVVRWVGNIISAEHERSSIASLPQPVNIDVCDSNDIGVKVSPSSVRVPAGGSLEVGVELMNEAARECSFSASDLHVALSVGEEKVWTPTVCGPNDKTLLLAPEQGWVTKFSWDGGVYVDCNRVNLEITDDEGNPIPATPPVGTYDLRVSIQGAEEDVEQQIVVE